MTGKRNLFDELIQGIDDTRAHREGRILLRSHVAQDLAPQPIDTEHNPANPKAAQRVRVASRRPR